MVRKILKCLPKNWELKVTAIQEASDLNTLGLDELLRLLMTHEILIKTNDNNNDKKKKGIAFKISTQEKDEYDKNSSDVDGDIAMSHIKYDCPNLKKMKKKKKSKRRAMAAWEESDYSNSDSESSDSKVANLCFMGIEDDENC
ncbi:hypothetical protein ACSBR2_037786 [Camellia fascicularis]